MIKKSLTSKGGRAALVLTLSAGLIATVALPAYAMAPGSQEAEYVAETSQSLQVADTVVSGTVQRSDFAASTNAEIQQQEQAEAAQAAAAALAERQTAAAAAGATSAQLTATRSELPSGSGASGLLSAALAQLGRGQDCTALVENALRAIGYSVGDLGPMQFGAYGTPVTDGSIAPGDIMMRGGHVAIYAGNGMAVHGGFGGTTVLSAYDASPSGYVSIVRPG